MLDDKALLGLMMEDYRSCDASYRWTNYWSGKCQLLLDFLQATGLQDFRRNRDPKGTGGAVLASFGAVDLNPASPPDSMYERAEGFGRKAGAVPLQSLSVSQVGSPEVFSIGNGTFSYSWLNFYIRYAYVRQFFAFGDCTIVEIGSGSGKQAELLKKAHPGATILLFDIPPQLYVANQYLKSVFPGEVVDYSRTREITRAAEIEKGKIHLFPNWKIGIAAEIDIDLFWNAASFQEMEPETVKHYLQYVSHAANVYLMQVMYGQSQAPRPGDAGVLQKTQLPHYFEYLHNHQIIDLTTAALAIPLPYVDFRYSDTFWQRV